MQMLVLKNQSGHSVSFVAHWDKDLGMVVTWAALFGEHNDADTVKYDPWDVYPNKEQVGGNLTITSHRNYATVTEVGTTNKVKACYVVYSGDYHWKIVHESSVHQKVEWKPCTTLHQIKRNTFRVTTPEDNEVVSYLNLGNDIRLIGEGKLVPSTRVIFGNIRAELVEEETRVINIYNRLIQDKESALISSIKLPNPEVA